MPTTTNGFTYPAATATPDVPRDIQQLATDLETKFASVLAAPTDYTPTLTNVTGGTVAGSWSQVGKWLFLTTAVAAVTVSLPAGKTADATVGSALAAVRSQTAAAARVNTGATVVTLTQADGTGWPASPSLAATKITGMVLVQ